MNNENHENTNENNENTNGFSGSAGMYNAENSLNEKSEKSEQADRGEKADGFSDKSVFDPVNLFTKYLDKGAIFKNRDVLMHTYAPNALPHRKDQIESIAAILAPAIRNETPSNILIYGMTGTGKTSSVNYVGNALKKACRDMGKVCNVIFLNCELLDTQYRVLYNIATELENLGSKPSNKPRSGIPNTGWSTDQVYTELKNMIDSIGGVNVIVLDEIDKLVRKSGDEILYNLTRFNSDLKNAKVSLIGISNNLQFTTFLDARVLSSLSEQELVFDPYDAPQLCDILQQRANDAFVDGALEEGVIPRCAALAAQEHGDARRALDLLRTSGDIASRENAAKVTEIHVKSAQKKIDVDTLNDCVKTLPLQSKAVLYSMLMLADINKQTFTTGEVMQVYREVAPLLNLDILTHRRIADLIADLNTLGIINSRTVSRGRYGRTKEMSFSPGTGGIKKAILEDKDFDEEILSSIDMSRFRTPFR